MQKDILILTDEDKEKRAKYEQIDSFIDEHGSERGTLIEILHKAQGLFGYLPRDLQLHIARRMDIPGAEIFGVVSFYSYFNMMPPGKNTVSICMGTACFVRGADKIIGKFKERLGIDSDETTDDGMFTLKDIRCVGACGLAPVVMVGDKVFGRVTEQDVDKIIDQYKG